MNDRRLRSSFSRGFLSVFVTLFLLWASMAQGLELSGDHDADRANVISLLIRQSLGMNHFAQKKIDDDLSKAAFDLYIKLLDPQKRFLFKEDVEKLRAHSTKIDDEMNTGVIRLPMIAMGLLNDRTRLVQGMVRDILSEEFDYRQDETLETDPEKYEFTSSEAELRERWRKVLKYQVIHRYLGLVDDETPEGDGKTGDEKEKKTPEELKKTAREKVAKNYEDAFSRMLQEKRSEHFDRYFRAFTKAFDPHTDYMAPMSKEDFDISMRGSLEGIGATLREDEGYIKVESIIPGGPAYRQGQLEPGDIILRVAEKGGDPVDITDMRVRDAVRYIRGKKGSEVRLTVKKTDGRRLLIAIVRDVVSIEDTFAKRAVIKDEKTGKRFGYLKLPHFYRDFEKTKGNGGRNSTDDVRSELKRLEDEQISGLILDLRNNGGGALTDAIQIAGLFIETGPVVQIKDRKGDTRVLSDTSPEIEYGGPVVILVNTFSASASEILAGALQDYGRAFVMGGDHTFGKGTVQMVVNLDNAEVPDFDKYRPFGALKVTIQKFYRISGESTQYRGIIPDIAVPEQKTFKTGEQYLDYALPWDTISPAQYRKWKDLQETKSSLREKSKERILTNEDFQRIEKDNRMASEKREMTNQSLHVDNIRKERDELKAADRDGKKDPKKTDLDKKKSAGRLTEEERTKLWLDEVEKDPQVREAMGVLRDVLTPDGGVSLN